MLLVTPVVTSLCSEKETEREPLEMVVCENMY